MRLIDVGTNEKQLLHQICPLNIHTKHKHKSKTTATTSTKTTCPNGHYSSFNGNSLFCCVWQQLSTICLNMYGMEATNKSKFIVSHIFWPSVFCWNECERTKEQMKLKKMIGRNDMLPDLIDNCWSSSKTEISAIIWGDDISSHYLFV